MGKEKEPENPLDNEESTDDFDNPTPNLAKEEKEEEKEEEAVEEAEYLEEEKGVTVADDKSINSQLTAPKDLATGLEQLGRMQGLEQQRAFAEVLVKSKLVPKGLDTPEKVIVAMNMGDELGVKRVTAVNNIHVINGKAGLSVHLVAALLRLRGLTYRLKKDALKEMVAEIDKDGNPTEKRDIVTTIEFTVPWFNPVTQKMQLEIQEMTFTWSDAVKAGYNTKDTWLAMPKVMMRNRCLVIGARFVCPEALNGLYEVTELLDTDGIRYDVDEEGTVKNIGKK